MTGPSILLIIDREQPEDAARQRAATVMHHWSSGQAPSLLITSIQSMIDHACSPSGGTFPWRNAGAAWLLLDTVDEGDLWEVLGQLEEASIPTLLSRGDETEPPGAQHQPGVVVCPPEADERACCLMLQTLHAQAGLFQSLRSEIKVLSAHRGGLADQIEQIDEELRLAAQLQQEFVPNASELPHLNGVSFDVLWRPAGYVSGDIYDVFQLDEEHVGFFIADAVGHGVPAALMTMYIKRSLKTKHTGPGLPGGYRILEPSESLALLNVDMCNQQTGRIRFATAAYGIINCKTLEMRFSRAGHPYPMWLHGQDDEPAVEPEGGLLGVFPEEEYEQSTIQLNPGDRFLLYSDGFEVAFPQHDGTEGALHVANERYLDEFRSMRGRTNSQAIEDLEHKLDHHAGSLNQRDDLTIISLSVDAKAHVAAPAKQEAAA